VVVQDCRGRHGSEGRFEKYTAEAEDGFDTVAWIHAQPWCSGRIGTMGLSYAAHTQAALAALDPPGLSAMVLDSGGFSNAFQGGIRQGGAFELKQATWAWKQAKESPEAQADPLVRTALEAEDIRAWFTRTPWRTGRSPVRWVPDYERYLLDQWSHGIFDEAWKRPGLCASAHYDAFTDCPTVIMSSWYDAYVATATENYVGLKGRKRGPYRLIMGPWLHGDRTTAHAGDISFGPQAPIDGNVAETWLAFRLAWFDRWLKGEPSPEPDPPVRLFLMGGGIGRRDDAGRLEHGGRWIEASDWPVPEAVPTPFFIHDDGGRFFGCKAFGLPLSARADVLSFETAPLPHDIAVVGPVEVHLWVSSDAPDTDFTAKLVDVYPPSADDPRGFALNITDGILRCRYRDSWEKAVPLEPGRSVRIVIRPFATANLFKAGHRIRLDISSSNFPKYDVNPNSFEPEGQAETPRRATNRVWMDKARPSHVVLSILPER
jgi:predicted acyl esterase